MKPMFSHEKITTFKSIKTPFYYYDMELLKNNLSLLLRITIKYNVKVHYAFKANTNTPILDMIREFGFGADCVSGNEMKKAIETGFNKKDIFFAGVGKTDEEIIYGLQQNIGSFNVESLHELQIIDSLANKLALKAPIALRINPDVDGHTKPGITTGTKLDKFGIDKDEIPKAIKLLKELKNIKFIGLHFHIGSQITDLNIFKTLSLVVNTIQKVFINSGFFPKIINLGGGLGVDYENPDKNPIPDYESFFKVYKENINLQGNQELHFELGRAVVAHCGTLVSRVLFLKQSGENNFAIIDAGMNNFMRPALYGAVHKLQNLTGIGKETKYHVAGPICESSDIFAKNVYLPEIKRGDLIAIRSTGAYGEVMSSAYNLRDNATAIYSHEFNASERKSLAVLNNF
jgi:diaminopimelate decarboxylase